MATTLETLNVVVSAETKEFQRRMGGLTAGGGPIARIGTVAIAATSAAGAAFAGLSALAVSKGNELETAMADVFKLLPDMSDEAKRDHAGLRDEVVTLKGELRAVEGKLSYVSSVLRQRDDIYYRAVAVVRD